MDIEFYKAVLKDKKMKYVDLANATGLSLGCIKRIMAGIAQFPRVDTIEAIENALDIKGITFEEYKFGFRNTKKESITPIEDDMLYAFRKIGQKYGEETQRAAIKMLENML